MKKCLTIFTYFILTIVLTGCIQKVKIPLGVIPTKEFTIYDYIQDDAVYQASSELSISGLSEEGVVIVATLYDNKGNNIVESYCTTNSDCEWELKLNTPSASMKTYSLKIKDSNETYRKTITDIRFGETWLILGDNIENAEPIETVDYNNELSIIDYDKMFYYNGKWVPASSEISVFAYNLINEIVNSQKIWSQFPVAMIFATEEDTAIYEWLSVESIESRKMINNYLDFEEIVINEENNIRYTAANLNNKYMDYLSKMSYANLIFNQGIKDITDLNNHSHYKSISFENMYSMCLYTFISELISNLNIYNEIYFIQDSINEVNNIEILRKVQINISKFYNIVNIVPTYDLCVLYDISNQEVMDKSIYELESYDYIKNLGYNTQLLARRIYEFDRNNLRAPLLDNVVQVYDEENNLISIKLIFDNLDSFDIHEETFGLKFYDINDQQIDLEYEFLDNELIIDLAYELDLTVVEEEQDKLQYYNIAYITYGYDDIIYNNNLTSKGIPFLPFEVIIK